MIYIFFGYCIKVYGKGLDGKLYDMSDVYVFSKEFIYLVDKLGVIVKYGDYFYYIGFGEFE